nr:hypothetical protein [Moraxella osloensis]
MKVLKLAAIPAALIATSAFAETVVVDQQVVAQPVAVSTTTYDPNSGVVRNTTTQLVTGTRTFFDTVTNPAAISAEVGTLGYGANLGWALNDKTELVVGWAGGDLGDLKDTVEFNDTEYDLETDFSNPYIGVQMRPMGNWFTVGAGTIVGDNEITLKKDANTNPVKINGNEYRGNIGATAETKNNMNPYLTIGFRPNITNNFGVFGEIGAAYTGGLKVTKATINDANGNAITNYPNLKADLQKDLDDSDYSEWFPIAKIGATYRF